MRFVRRLATALAGLAVLGGLAAGGYELLHRPAAAETVATYTVSHQAFVRRVTAEGNLRSVDATRLTAPRTGIGGGMKIAWLAADGTVVTKGAAVARFDPSESEKSLRDGTSDLDAANAKLAEERVKSAAAVAGRETDADLASDELHETQQFQAKDQEIFSRNQIIESEVDATLAGAKQQHADDAKQIERRRSQSNAAVIGVEQARAKLAIDHANQALASMQMTAPHDGIFVIARDWKGHPIKVGDQVWPGQPVGELPLLDAMEAEVYVLEVDGSGLVEKQPADVVLESRPDQVFHGTIKLVDKLAQPRQDGSPVQYFGVTIALDHTDRDAMKPGQRVQATLILDQESAIVVPRQAVFDKDARTIVYKRTATGFAPVTVELGAATAGRVVIKSGLGDGDEIALRDPTQTADALGSAGSAAAGAKGAP